MQKVSFPTGKDVPSCNAMPSREPAQQMAYSGASSQKYFSDVRARGISCTSSNTMSVVCGLIGFP